MKRCYLAEFAPKGLRECDGRVQSHHVVKQQTLRRGMPPLPPGATDIEVRARKLAISMALKDSRNLLSVCKRHHDAWHSHRRDEFSLTRADLPDGLEAFSEEHGLDAELYRQFGPAREAA